MKYSHIQVYNVFIFMTWLRNPQPFLSAAYYGKTNSTFAELNKVIQERIYGLSATQATRYVNYVKTYVTTFEKVDSDVEKIDKELVN
jgi:hypothetical protein